MLLRKTGDLYWLHMELNTGIPAWIHLTDTFLLNNYYKLGYSPLQPWIQFIELYCKQTTARTNFRAEVR